MTIQFTINTTHIYLNSPVALLAAGVIEEGDPNTAYYFANYIVREFGHLYLAIPASVANTSILNHEPGDNLTCLPPGHTTIKGKSAITNVSLSSPIKYSCFLVTSSE